MEISPNPDSEEKNQDIVRKRQKIITGSLLFVGLAAFTFGIYRITGTIDSPFKIKSSQITDSSSLLNSSQQTEIEQLKNKDTDKDGLKDYDELYLYQTSPYVRDSDSDGSDDKNEVESNNDPNCPKDQNCQISQTAPLEEATIPSEGELSSEDLRTTLKNMGAPANLVDAMDDATLQQVYDQTLAETGTTTDQLTNTGEIPSNLEDLAPSETSSQAITLETLQSLDAAQLRTLLQQSGVDEATLSQVDDTTLEPLYQQALGEQLQTVQ